MGILTGAMTLRRFRVEGALPGGWREVVRERLAEMAFREPVGGARDEELEGWVRVDDLLDTSFADPAGWLVHPWVVFALRVDKKSLPRNLVKATVAQEVRAWCLERGVERCPASERKRILEELEDRWYARQLPRVQTVEVAWHVVDGYALIGTAGEKMTDRVRTRFHRTFGLDLQPWSPIDSLTTPGLASSLLATAPFAGGQP